MRRHRVGQERIFEVKEISMLVKINDKIYDSNEEPILLVLEDFEKDHIANMGDQKKYCSFPEDYDIEKIKEFMKTT